MTRLKTSALVALTVFNIVNVTSVSAGETDNFLSLIVMDPLAAPLSCPCVEGYAQRRYEVLAKHLESQLGMPVRLTFGESLEAAGKKSGRAPQIVIGKDSVIRADARDQKINVSPLAQLTDQAGTTTQHGLIVVGRDDPAKTIKDLNGYTIIFGPSEAHEKHSAAMTLLKKAGVAIPAKLTIDAACSDGACKVVELGPESKTAAVISSYAQPLLEGCGTVKKGDLRVVGKTAPVPFITAFASDNVPAQMRGEVSAALLNVATKPDVLEALESLVGFLPVDASNAEAKVEATVTKKKS